jgi:hypothetical protein
MPVHRRESGDPLTAHRDDHLAAVGDVPYISAQVVVKLTHADLILRCIM